MGMHDFNVHEEVHTGFASMGYGGNLYRLHWGIRDRRIWYHPKGEG